MNSKELEVLNLFMEGIMKGMAGMIASQMVTNRMLHMIHEKKISDDNLLLELMKSTDDSVSRMAKITNEIIEKMQILYSNSKGGW